MPQGGVDQNENLVTAMKRARRRNKYKKYFYISKTIDKWLEYELPQKPSWNNMER